MDLTPGAPVFPATTCSAPNVQATPLITSSVTRSNELIKAIVLCPLAFLGSGMSQLRGNRHVHLTLRTQSRNMRERASKIADGRTAIAEISMQSGTMVVQFG